MNLGKHIYILLKKEAAVYVEGLGVFRKIHTPSVFDAGKNVFLPPVKFIEFDSEATEGYDLIHYLQQTGTYSKEEATAQLEEAVAIIKEQITSTGQATLDNLGHLVGYGAGYVFKPIDLSGFNLGPVAAATEVVVEATEEPKEVQVPEEDVTPEEEIQEIAPVEAIDDPETAEKTTSGNRSFIYGLVAAIALLVLGGLYYYYQYYMDVPRYTVQNTVQSVEQELTVPVDTASVLEDTLTNAIDTAQQIIEAEDLPVVNTPRVEHKYAIVIGTHRTLAQAYEEAEAFNKDGHASVRVLTPNLAKNLKKVIWDTYVTKEERDSALTYVRKHVKTDAWPTVLNGNNE